MLVATILARGGSKRIIRKNIKEFRGKPMIAWTIENAKKSKLFKHIIVSTDDEEIAEVSKEYGAEVPFKRPSELSDDFAGTNEVMAHVVSWMQKENWEPEAICCIYATSVFFTIDDLKKGIKALKIGNWSYAFSVTEFEYTIFRSLKVNNNGAVKMFFPKYNEYRSQDLPIAMHDAGQFYWGTPDAWIGKEKIFGSNSYAIKIPHWRVQDIDTEDDWKRAEILFNQLKQ